MKPKIKAKYEEYKPTNREKARAPKQGLSWCGGCDANMVGFGAKCSVCGWTDGTHKAKK